MASSKGKEKALPEQLNSLFDSDSDIVTQAELDDLLEKARVSFAEKAATNPKRKKREWKPPRIGKYAPQILPKLLLQPNSKDDLTMLE